MDGLFLRANVDSNHEIWISEVSRATFDANEIDDLGTDYGYFVLLGSKRRGGQGGAKILAKAASAQAAYELFRILTDAHVSFLRESRKEPSKNCTITRLPPKRKRKISESIIPVSTCSPLQSPPAQHR